MELRELRPGLWRWTAFHPEWKEDVGSVAYEGLDELVLVDPLLPSDGRARRRWSDEVGKPVVVLVTVFWHTRNADVRGAPPPRPGAHARRGEGRRTPSCADGGALPSRRRPARRGAGDRHRPGERGGLLDPASTGPSSPGDVLLGAPGGVRHVPAELAPCEREPRPPGRVASAAARPARDAGARLARRARAAKRSAPRSSARSRRSAALAALTRRRARRRRARRRARRPCATAPRAAPRRRCGPRRPR